MMYFINLRDLILSFETAHIRPAHEEIPEEKKKSIRVKSSHE